MIRILTILILSSVLIGVSAFAEESLIRPQSQDGIDFLTGGNDVEEYQAMRALQGNYNLRMTFAIKNTGAYLADVNVLIRNPRGETVLDSVADGAFFYAKLPPGRYIVTADRDENVIHKSILVPRTHAVSVPVYFPKGQGD